jgi:phosphate transport system permease protein
MFGPGRRYWKDHAIQWLLFLAASSSVAVTTGIVATLLLESAVFFQHVSLWEFLTGTEWAPSWDPPHHGILPLVAGTIVTTGVALAVALPMGTLIAVYLSEYAPFAFREIIKPVLELLSAVPTVVYGYFALLFVTPLLKQVLPELEAFSMLSAGIVMGIMIIPYVSSLSEDAMRAVPMLLREGAYALGANKLITSTRVVYPAALSGIGAAYILGISRAIGETMIVAIAAGLQPNLTWNPTEPGATITAYIVQVSKGELPREGPGYKAIFAAGLTLFVMTLGFNIVGHILRKRFREAY